MKYELDDELRGDIDHEVWVRGVRCEKPFSQTLSPLFSKVWITTTDYSRQSSGTLAGSQPVGVYLKCVFILTICSPGVLHPPQGCLKDIY